jgi:hypothetical protein
MQAWTSGAPQRIAGEIDITLDTAGEGGHDGSPKIHRDVAHTAEVPIGGCRKAGLDHIDTQRVQLAREAELLLGREAIPGGLFAVPKGSVEDDDVSCHDAAPSALFGLN